MTDHTYKVVPDSVPHVGGMVLDLSGDQVGVHTWTRPQPEGTIVNV